MPDGIECPRCHAEVSGVQTWCRDCEREFDTWSRRHAADVIWAVLGGMVVVITAGMVLPILGVPWILSTTGAFAGFATILGIARWNKKRRRGQFLRGGSMPRAYVPEKT
ncbi:MAG TPA: hypothetical protein VFQ53_07730 [Kofleriaceae bacterium]|nr:hypothetical protein [Kofleriaceae bacterium]